MTLLTDFKRGSDCLRQLYIKEIPGGVCVCVLLYCICNTATNAVIDYSREELLMYCTVQLYCTNILH